MKLKNALAITVFLILSPFIILWFLIDMMIHPMEDRPEWHDEWS